MADPAVLQRLREVGFEPMADPSIDEAMRSMRDEYQKFGEPIRRRGIKVQ